MVNGEDVPVLVFIDIFCIKTVNCVIVEKNILLKSITKNSAVPAQTPPLISIISSPKARRILNVKEDKMKVGSEHVN